GGMDPPGESPEKLGLMLCPEGRVARRTPRRASRSMSLLYGRRTDRLSAFRQADLPSPPTNSTGALARRRRTVTHSAGMGILAGLNQKHSWARWNPTCSTSAIRSLKWYRERVGEPGL